MVGRMMIGSKCNTPSTVVANLDEQVSLRKWERGIRNTKEKISFKGLSSFCQIGVQSSMIESIRTFGTKIGFLLEKYSFPANIMTIK